MFQWIHSYYLREEVAQACARISNQDPLFDDHFPGAPVLPGSVLIELGAQVAGPLVESKESTRLAFLAMVRSAKFHKPVPLQCELMLAAQVLQRDKSTARVRVSVASIVDMELVMALLDVDASPEALSERAARLERWKEAW
jgi:3-hydroxyacyl-[acyl-carrier-protein] dehydratase